MKHQAKKIETFYDKYFNTVVYEYRGHRYEVTYAKDWTCSATAPHIQHRDAQEKIDQMIDHTAPEPKTKPVDLDEIWKMMGWD